MLMIIVIKEIYSCKGSAGLDDSVNLHSFKVGEKR